MGSMKVPNIGFFELKTGHFPLLFGNQTMVIVCCLVLECEAIPKSATLKKVVVDAGPAADGLLTVVTNAPNIRAGTRTAVALIGSVVDDAGSELTIKRAIVGGVTSDGMICDSIMLGWVGGAHGLCVQLPDSIALGDPAPTTKPRLGGEAASAAAEAAPAEAGPSKEDKKAAAAAKKAAMKEKLAAKRSAKAGGASAATEEAEAEAEAEITAEGVEKLAL